MNANKILIVEDNAVVGEKLKLQLKKMGFDIAGIAVSGEAAVDMAGKYSPDIVLMDIGLDGFMDGVDAAEIIGKKYDLPIVYLTGCEDEKTLDRVKNSAPYGYIPKPVDARTLQTTVESALFRRRMEIKLKRSERKYRLLFESAPFGIFRASASGRILDINEEMGKIAGYPGKTAVLGKSAKIFFPGGKEWGKMQVKLERDAFFKGLETRLRRKDGSFAWVSINARQCGGLENDTAFSEWSMEDITDRKNAEMVFRRAHRELERREVEKTWELVGANELLEKEIQERKQAVEALEKSEAELQLLSERLLAIQEQERERISHELHDSVGQMLTFAKMSLSKCIESLGENNETDISWHLSAVVGKIQESIEEVRGICAGLRPPMLEYFGILKTAEGLCEDFQKNNSGLAVDFVSEATEDEIRSDLKIVLYRILQEAFNNIAKHSRCERVEIRIAGREGLLRLLVRDDGVGFQPEKITGADCRAGGIGLVSMKKRVQASGGDFSLVTKPGGGTAIKAIWPTESS